MSRSYAAFLLAASIVVVLACSPTQRNFNEGTGGATTASSSHGSGAATSSTSTSHSTSAQSSTTHTVATSSTSGPSAATGSGATTGSSSGMPTGWSEAFGTGNSYTRGFGIGIGPDGSVIVGGFADGSICGVQAPTTAMFVAKLTPAGKCVWAKVFPNVQSSNQSLAVDGGDGSVVIAGNFTGQINLGGATFSAPNNPEQLEFFVAKLDSNGNHVWSNSFGNPDAPDSNSRYIYVAVKPMEQVALTGSFNGSVDFGTGTTFTSSAMGAGIDLFLVSLDAATGTTQWADDFPGAGNTETATAVAFDPTSGGIGITGMITGSMTFGPNVPPIDGQSIFGDIFVATFDFNGTGQSANVFGDPTDNQTLTVGPSAIAFDSGGEILVAGSWSGQINFGGSSMPLDTKQGDNCLVVKLLGGGAVFASIYGDPTESTVDYCDFSSVATDPAGNVYLLGYFAGNVDFGGKQFTSTGKIAIVAVKLDPNGKHIASYMYGGGENTFAGAMAVDVSGDAFVTGAFDNTIDFGSGTLKSGGQYTETFVAELKL